MTQPQKKSWIEDIVAHLKKNIIPAIGLIGSAWWFLHMADSHLVKIELNQQQSIEWQKKAEIHLGLIDTHINSLDTLRFEFRELRNEMNYRFQMEHLTRRAGLSTESRDANGNPIFHDYKLKP